MTRLLMLVEGQSEEIFVKKVLQPHLVPHGVYVQPTVLWTKRLSAGGGFRGGVSSWNKIHENLRLLMRDGNAWVSTLLDFYGFPKDFPGLPEIGGDPQEKVVALQKCLAAELPPHPRFIPFLALHEFEAWLFSAPDTVEEHFGDKSLAAKLREAGEPERINHGEKTHPKARLKSMDCGYKETSDGPTLLGKIGLATVREKCPHFNGWLTRLETLGKEAP
ncbi:DUF4276 family protein [Verminephrobacter aporrectodeae]|uniref:DUF4276 family protein n=1 Tax=Verminephrobacter aporrectodeae TaxID=1110389 RepID=UPI00224364F3|nr:DUF4276 family protein [Verminephrobacter aporrectodeae]MCW8174450.1 DUF4276 family protein [Verminephrobacter aporrectodeae subsp. tuberculatae]MCW8201789.1 DUF4276 family protein [Verminephrobacter aporrectodeae subsp. tuberculatae]